MKNLENILKLLIFAEDCVVCLGLDSQTSRDGAWAIIIVIIIVIVIIINLIIIIIIIVSTAIDQQSHQLNQKFNNFQTGYGCFFLVIMTNML